LLSRSVPRRAVVSSSSPGLSVFIILETNYSYVGRDYSTQETNTIESHVRLWGLRSALLFLGHFTIAIGITANHPHTIRIYAYSICSARVIIARAVSNYVIFMTKPSPRHIRFQRVLVGNQS
jgi:hypothetical protein